jgi:translation initiation factor eIF-2B subunit alpha
VSVLAKEAKKPFYVAAESYKFCRLYPLSPTDLPKAESEAAPKHVDGSAVRSIPSDFTPPDKVREQERNEAKLFSISKE